MARSTQAGEHGRFLLPYTETFPGSAMLCIAYLAIAQKKGVYVLHAPSRVKVLSEASTGGPRAGGNGNSAILKSSGRQSQHPELL